MHEVAGSVLDYIRREELLKPGDRVGVAVSGGADSVALLRLLLDLRSELGIVLSVVHLNHMLRGPESDEDEKFVSRLAEQFKLEFHSERRDVSHYSRERRLSIETAARELRYQFFATLFGGASKASPLTKIATGHTIDDQAETVLMRLIRGTGMRGLSAIRPHMELLSQQDDQISSESRRFGHGEIVRPLLLTRRCHLKRYLEGLGQLWREDATNREDKFTRNRVRSVLLPLLEREFNPQIVEVLSDLAEIAYGEQDFWENEIAGWMGTRIHWTPAGTSTQDSERSALVQLKPFDPDAQERAALQNHDSRNRSHESGHEDMTASIDLPWLLAEPMAVQRRAIKAIGDYANFPLEFKHVDEIVRFASLAGSSKTLALPLGWKVVREKEELVFIPPGKESDSPLGYEYKLRVPGRVSIPEIATSIEALEILPNSSGVDLEQEHLFDESQLANELTVRNWRPGDRFWPAHTKSAVKIKKLLQEHHVPLAERARWPVVVSNEEIIWVRGLPGRAHYRPQLGQSAVLIRALRS